MSESWLDDAAGVMMFMRVQGQSEIPIGRASCMEDVPGLLRAVARRWEDGVTTDPRPRARCDLPLARESSSRRAPDGTVSLPTHER